MSAPPRSSVAADHVSWSTEQLVAACRLGDAEAWSALIARYKNLIYSIPVRYGLPPEDAADVFQAVCLDLLSELPRLREPRALPAWLIQVTRHTCFRLRRKAGRYLPLEGEDGPPPEADPTPGFAGQLEREQYIREAVSTLPERCRELVRMLFFEDPPRPYRDVANELGLAVGSIGFIRGRCLEQLRRRVVEDL